MMHVIDVMVVDFALPPEVKEEILNELQKRGLPHACCSACGEYTNLSFMRKLTDEPTEHAMCVPCFLLNHTDTDQDIIDKIAHFGINKGFYFD